MSDYTGLLGALILTLLCLTSNDLSLRKLRGPSWKGLQRTNYILFSMVVLHSIGYQSLENRRWGYLCFFYALGALVAITQLAGAMIHRKSRPTAYEA